MLGLGAQIRFTQFQGQKASAVQLGRGWWYMAAAADAMMVLIRCKIAWNVGFLRGNNSVHPHALQNTRAWVECSERPLRGLIDDRHPESMLSVSVAGWQSIVQDKENISEWQSWLSMGSCGKIHETGDCDCAIPPNSSPKCWEMLL